MITISGALGGDALWGTFPVANYGTPSKGNLSGVPYLDEMVPPSDWILPPPNNVWYDCEHSRYGPTVKTLDVGFIESDSSRDTEWKPCKHSTIEADVFYRGPSGTKGPYFRYLDTSSLSRFYPASLQTQPSGYRTKLFTGKGRPRTNTDKTVVGYTGVNVSQTYTRTLNGEDRYWYYDSLFPGSMLPVSFQNTLSSKGGIPYSPSQWYMRRNDDGIITNPANNVYWHRAVWSRLSDNSWSVLRQIEFHSPASYTPYYPLGSSGAPSLVSQNERQIKVTVTHIVSEYPGQFRLRLSVKTDLTWRGFTFPSAFSGSASYLTNTTCVLLVLQPGLPSDRIATDVELGSLNSYCWAAPSRASLLYNFRSADLARVNAANDVQSLKSNWLENMSGLKGSASILSFLTNGYKAVMSGDMHAARRALSSAYLAYTYVVAPTVKDIKDVKSQGANVSLLAWDKRFSRERRRGSYHESDVPVLDSLAQLSYYDTFILKLKDNPFSSIWNSLERLRLDPSIGQLWDLVPFSFVVDWFVDIGSALKSYSAVSSLKHNRELLSRIETFKAEWSLRDSELKALSGGAFSSIGKPITYSWYNRKVFSDLGRLNPLSITPTTGLSLSQMTQGTALLTQYLS